MSIASTAIDIGSSVLASGVSFGWHYCCDDCTRDTRIAMITALMEKLGGEYS